MSAKDSVDFNLMKAGGHFSILEITCLPGTERMSFIRSASTLCRPGDRYPLAMNKSDLFPFKIQCICGYEFKIVNNETIPNKSKKCACGTYLIKYNLHTIH